MSDKGSGFAAGTLVHTKEGLKPIEEIRVGHRVLSYPRDQVPPQRLREPHEFVYREVTATHVYEDELICGVTAWDLANNIKDIVEAMPEQLIYVKDNGWTAAKRLKFGKVLESNDFANLLVKKRIDTHQSVRSFAIDVCEFHTYYVGKLGVWVHGLIHESHGHE